MGEGEGATVGRELGVGVGGRVGVGVGRIVGGAVGSSDGAKVGSGEGTAEGDKVVGALVGAAVDSMMIILRMSAFAGSNQGSEA